MNSLKQREQRKYQAIWERIKRRDLCEIMISHPRDVARVKKAVIKEKNSDVGFKVVNELDPHRLHISYDPEVGKMTFVLKQMYGIGMQRKVVA